MCDPTASGQGKRSGIRREFAEQQLEQASLASAIRSNDSNPLTICNIRIRIFEQGLWTTAKGHFLNF
jgi:hypothetical protein